MVINYLYTLRLQALHLLRDMSAEQATICR